MDRRNFLKALSTSPLLGTVPMPAVAMATIFNNGSIIYFKENNVYVERTRWELDWGRIPKNNKRLLRLLMQRS